MGIVRTKFYLTFPVKIKNGTKLLPHSGKVECRDGFKGSGWEARSQIKLMKKVGMLPSTEAISWVESLYSNSPEV